MNLVQEIQKALKKYEFPNSLDYQAPNVCYAAIDKDEIPKSILQGLREAYWPYRVSIKQALERDLISIIEKSIEYYKNYPLSPNVVYVIRTSEKFCKDIEEVLKNCFSTLDENILLEDLKDDYVTGSGVSERTSTSSMDEK